MSDLFHADVPDAYILAVARVMVLAEWHTFQVLTKRAERLRALLGGDLWFAARKRHIWWGVSVENRRYGLPRIDELRASLAAVRFLSIEPLLEDLGQIDFSGIDWTIVGGESGPGARLMSGEWVESIRQQCVRASVPFFFKQWGGVHKTKAGRILNGRTYDDFPERLGAGTPSFSKRSTLIHETENVARQWQILSNRSEGEFPSNSPRALDLKRKMTARPSPGAL